MPTPNQATAQTNLAAAVAAGKSATILEHPIARSPGLCGGAIVLRYNPTSPHPLMTHFRNDDLGGFHKGNYFGVEEIGDAVFDFQERVRRER